MRRRLSEEGATIMIHTRPEWIDAAALTRSEHTTY
jgi:hypothetical protein